MPQHRRLVAGFSPWRPEFTSMWEFWWTKWHWDRLFSESFFFPCQYHSMAAPYSLKYHLGPDNGSVSGRISVETQSQPIVKKNCWTVLSFSFLFLRQVRAELMHWILLRFEDRTAAVPGRQGAAGSSELSMTSLYLSITVERGNTWRPSVRLLPPPPPQYFLSSYVSVFHIYYYKNWCFITDWLKMVFVLCTTCIKRMDNGNIISVRLSFRPDSPSSKPLSGFRWKLVFVRSYTHLLTLYLRMLGWFVNNELEKMRKEAVVA
jgi:hypothetical protein